MLAPCIIQADILVWPKTVRGRAAGQLLSGDRTSQHKIQLSQTAEDVAAASTSPSSLRMNPRPPQPVHKGELAVRNAGRRALARLTDQFNNTSTLIKPIRQQKMLRMLPLTPLNGFPCSTGIRSTSAITIDFVFPPCGIHFALFLLRLSSSFADCLSGLLCSLMEAHQPSCLL